MWPLIRRLKRVQLTLGQAEHVAILVKQLRGVLAGVARDGAFSKAG